MLRFWFWSDTSNCQPSQAIVYPCRIKKPSPNSCAGSVGMPPLTSLRMPLPPRLETSKSTLPLPRFISLRSEEHTSELQSHLNLVCRLLFEKKKDNPPLSGRKYSFQPLDTEYCT